MITRIPLTVVFTAVLTAVPGAGGGSCSEQSPSVEVQSGYVEVPGGRLYYEMAGSGDVLVLVHGNAGDRRHWDHQFDELARHLRVVRYDVRGFGKSSLPVEGEPYAAHEDLAALLDHLDIPKAHIGGWSMGSAIAVDFVLAYPERAASLMPIGPWVMGYSSPAVQNLFADMDAVRTALAERGSAAAADAFREEVLGDTIRNEAAGAEFRRIAGDYSWWAFSHSSPQRFLEPSAVERLAEIQAPTLILTAEHDIPACLEIADLLDQSVPDSRKVSMTGTGHLLHMEKPEEFNRHVIDFLRSVGGE